MDFVSENQTLFFVAVVVVSVIAVTLLVGGMVLAIWAFSGSCQSKWEKVTKKRYGDLVSAAQVTCIAKVHCEFDRDPDKETKDQKALSAADQTKYDLALKKCYNMK